MAEWGTIRIGKTYHEKGFFNETNRTPQFPRPDDLRESTIVLECMGSKTSDTISAKVRYRNASGKGAWINLDHLARVFGGTRLAQWFGNNIAVGEEVQLQVTEPLHRYRITDSKVTEGVPSALRSSDSPAAKAGTQDRSSKGGSQRRFGPYEFEALASEVMAGHFGVPLAKGSLPGVAKEFDMVSPDCSIAGDAKFFTLVRGEAPPPAKFSVIAEHVWLLEKTKATHRFLVFGNDRRVPVLWLSRFGELVENVEFYFLDHETGDLESYWPEPA